MEWAQLVVGLIEHVAWPTVVLLIIILLRQPLKAGLASVLERLESFSVETPAGSAALNMRSESARLALEAADPQENQLELEQSQPLVPNLVLSIRQVEDLYDRIYNNLQLLASRKSVALHGLDARALAEGLALEGALPQSLATAIASFSDLRDYIISSGSPKLAQEAYANYAQLADSILLRLNSVT